MANILPDGGKGIGPDPTGHDYPFVRAAPDVRGLLADAYLAHEVRDAAPPLRATRLVGFGGAFLGLDPRCEIRVGDAAGTVVFDSTLATDYRSAAFGPRLKVHQWRTATAVCRVVQHTAFPDDASVVAWPDEIVPVDGRLDERASLVVPARIVRLRDPDTGTVAAGDLVFANGYNTTIDTEVSAAGHRRATQVTVAATAGSGLGRYPGCVAPDLVVRSVNGQKPGAAGDLALVAAGCLWVRRPAAYAGTPAVATPAAATLHLGNDCGACCECDDFVRVQRGALRTWGRLVAIAQDAEAARDAFAAIVAAWDAEKACVEAQVVRIALAPHDNRYVEVVVSICNHTRSCLRDTTLTLAFSASASAGAGLAPGATQISDIHRGMVPYAPSGAWPTYQAFFDAIQATSSGVLRTRLVLPAAGPGAVVTLAASAATPLPIAGLALPQSTTIAATFGD